MKTNMKKPNTNIFMKKRYSKKQNLIMIAAVIVVIAGYLIYEKIQDSISHSYIVPDTTTSIGEKEFARKHLSSVEIPGSVTTIGADAFSNNRLTSVVIGEGVTRIESDAFSNNRLTSVVIPDSVKYIGVNAFAGNSITRISIGADVSLGKEIVEKTRNARRDSRNSILEKRKTVTTYINNDVLGHISGDVRDSDFNDRYYISKEAGIYTRPSTDSRDWKFTYRD